MISLRNKAGGWHEEQGRETGPSDEELLLRYRERDEREAFEMLVERYERPIYNYLVRYLRSESLAEEVFQTTFLRVHEKRHSYSEKLPVRPWLYSIATNLAIDALRKEGRHQGVRFDRAPDSGEPNGVNSLAHLIGSDTPSPLEQMETAERETWLRQAVASLPAQLRRVLELIFYQGWKYQEVSDALNVPLGTVKSRVHKALVKLNVAWHRNHSPHD